MLRRSVASSFLVKRDLHSKRTTVVKGWYANKLEKESAEKLLSRGLRHGAECRYQEANELLTRSLRLLEKHVKPNVAHLTNAYNALGILQFTKGCLPKAKEHLDKALIVSASNQMTVDIGGLLNDSAVVLMKQGKLAKAQERLQRAKIMSEKANRPNLLLLTATNANLGEMFTQTGEFKRAEASLRKSTTWLSKMNKTDPSYAVSSAVVLGNLGRVCLFQHSYAEARHLLEHAAEISMKLERHPSQGKCLSNLALVHLYQQNSSTAIKLLRNARVCFKESVGNKHIDMVICLNNLATVSGLREAGTLFKRCTHILTEFNQQDHRVKECLETVTKNMLTLEKVKQEVKTSSFPPENLVEALQIGYDVHGTRLQLLSHCNHIMGVGMPSR